MGNKSKRGTCERCQAQPRILRYYKGKRLCWPCFKELALKGFNQLGSRKYSLEQALDRVYTIQGYNIKGTIRGTKSFPAILIGHKVRLVLADDEKSEGII